MVVNVLWMVGDHPKDSRRLTWGWWVTILGMVGDYPMNAGWPSWGWWATILKIVGGPWEGGWPPMAVDTWSYFCELSLYTNFQICRFWWGCYVAGDMFHELTGICSMGWWGFVRCDRGKTKSTPSPRPKTGVWQQSYTTDCYTNLLLKYFFMPPSRLSD